MTFSSKQYSLPKKGKFAYLLADIAYPWRSSPLYLSNNTVIHSSGTQKFFKYFTYGMLNIEVPVHFG